MNQSAPPVSVGLSGFTISPTGVLLRPHDDIDAVSSAALEAGRTWAVAEPGNAGADAWLALIDPRLATLLVVEADRSIVVRRRIERAATAKGTALDGVLVRDTGRVSQERAWPAVVEMIDEGMLRCAGLVTSRTAVLQRCMAWHPVDAVLFAEEGVKAAERETLTDVCRWSGVTVLVARGDEVRAYDPVAP